jgi:hypothetical protein
VLATSTVAVWREVRQKRRTRRLDAIRKAVKAIGAPARATEDATAMLLGLSGADASWPLHELYGLPLERIPGVIANTVALIVAQLKTLQRHSPAGPTARALVPPRERHGRRADGERTAPSGSSTARVPAAMTTRVAEDVRALTPEAPGEAVLFPSSPAARFLKRSSARRARSGCNP